MIKFCIITDDLLYRRQIEHCICNMFSHESYTIEYDLDTIEKFSAYVCIIDLESSDLESVCDLRENKFTSVIFLTSRKSEMEVFCYKFYSFDLIDKEEDYISALEEKLEKVICNTCYNQEKLKRIVFDNGIELSIPVADVISKNKIDNQYIVKCKKPNGKKYIYTFIFYSDLEGQFEELMLSSSSSKVRLFYCNSCVAVCEEKLVRKKYLKDFKDQLVSEYLNGVTVCYLSKKYDISPSTIYYWVNQYKINKRLLECETAHQKYKKIKEIVNSK